MTRKLLTGLLVAVILISLLELWGTNPKQTYRDQVAVLMYHHVHDTDQSSSTVSSALFRDQLSYLKKTRLHLHLALRIHPILRRGPRAREGGARYVRRRVQKLL